MLFITFHADYKANATNLVINCNILLDTNYVYTYPKSFLISPFYAQRNFLIKLSPTIGRNSTFIPNMSDAFGINIGYGNFRLQLATKFPNTTQSIEDKVKSTYTDLNLQMLKRKFIIELSYKNIIGFVDKDYEKIKPTDPMVYANPNMRVIYAKLNYTHIFSDKFSARAAYRLMERQKRGAGSWLLTGGLSYLRLGSTGRTGNANAFLDPNVRPDFGEYGTVRNMTAIGISALGGYGHTFVYKKFFFTAIGVLGLETERGIYQITTNKEITDFFITPAFDIKAVLGYNHHHWFAGISGHLETNQFRMGSARGSAIYETVGFFVGRRIQKDKIFKKKKK